MRRRLATTGLASLALAALVLTPGASAAKQKIDPVPGRYVGKFGEVGTISFTLKGREAEVKDFRIVIVPEPTCVSQPMGWPYALPRSTEYRPPTDADIYIYKGWKLGPIPSSPVQLGAGFYPFPPVPESSQITAYLTFPGRTFLGRFRTSSKVRGGALTLLSSNFVLANSSGDCRHFYNVPGWTAKHQSRRLRAAHRERPGGR